LTCLPGCALRPYDWTYRHVNPPRTRQKAGGVGSTRKRQKPKMLTRKTLEKRMRKAVRQRQPDFIGKAASPETEMAAALRSTDPLRRETAWQIQYDRITRGVR
jgi:hypothetical protein